MNTVVDVAAPERRHTAMFVVAKGVSGHALAWPKPNPGRRVDGSPALTAGDDGELGKAFGLGSPRAERLCLRPPLPQPSIGVMPGSALAMARW
jgi:hypothetical protein